MNNKIVQYKLENDSWEHSLDFSLNENILLKKRIAEIAHDQLDEMQLGIIEQLMNDVLEKDNMLQFLYAEIHNLNTLYSEIEKRDTWVLKHDSMRNDILAMERDIAAFRAFFNQTAIRHF